MDGIDGHRNSTLKVREDGQIGTLKISGSKIHAFIRIYQLNITTEHENLNSTEIYG